MPLGGRRSGGGGGRKGPVRKATSRRVGAAKKVGGAVKKVGAAANTRRKSRVNTRQARRGTY